MSEPYCLAMILCDNIHADLATGKQTILGTFSVVNSATFPASSCFCVYYAITDVDGKADVTFRIVNSAHAFEDGVDPVFEIKFEVESPSPLAVVEGSIMPVFTQLPEPGVYHCELLQGTELLMSRRLVALHRGKKQEEK